MIYKLLKFGIVGFSGLLIDFSITYVFKEFFKINRYVSNSLGFLTAASSNYLLNRIWTFNSDNPRMIFEYMSFMIVSSVGLLINNLFLYLFEKKYSFYWSKLFAIAVTTVWNFFANYLITFSL